MSREFEDMVDLEGLTPAERARLRRVHGLLVAAGPPVELPSGLLQPPPDAPMLAEVIPISGSKRRRRPLVVALVAAAVALACFGAGYLIADQAHPGSSHVAQVVSLQGPSQQDSFASLRVGSADSNGNSPMQLTVTGLPQLATQSRYVLMIWEKGRPTSFCGMFRVGRNGPTTVSFSVPYRITKNTRFVVTEMARGAQFPGAVVMTSS